MDLVMWSVCCSVSAANHSALHPPLLTETPLLDKQQGITCSLWNLQHSRGRRKTVTSYLEY